MRKQRSAVSVKLVVSGSSKESRIALVGRTGKELLTSATFTEPRAKGATLRALKRIFGSDVVVEDSTITNGRPGTAVPDAETVPATTAVLTQPTPEPTTAIAGPRRHTNPPAGKTPAALKTTKRSTKSGQAD
jgi:hypothetical protein